MEKITTWILVVTSILYNQVVCSDYSNDFEVLHTSGTGGLKSQSLYPEPSYNEKSRSILSSGDRRFTRDAFDPKSDYVDSHNALLWKYFDKAADYKIDERNDDDDRYGKTNDKYRQVSDDEQFEKEDYYDQAYDNYGKTNDNYRQVPDVEKVDHYDQAYDDYQYDRISSLSDKQNQENKQNPKNCKIVVIGEMKCSVCKDSAGTHSKSCSASSTPTKQKYEYTKQRLAAYSSADDDKMKKYDSEDQ